ncbi:type II toxin-antitoxin system death-on-curing family toxin [Enterobacter hormaechei]|uniref:type II toxin-antitoxin system death-on-curing family toxin n=1 Tax=Enterobacter cloacae complex TaxID=354276 RepID=UPI002A807F54|nr:type II toxin-antitoxin system death-on-curing family toxin [Enterobacter asburiae]
MDDIQYVYFDINHAIRLHDWIIEKSGGAFGIREQGLLESVLDNIQNDLYYPDFVDKICHLFFSVNKLHAFVDGNKRSSIALSTYFLTVNGFEHCVGVFVSEMENIAVWVAENAVSKELLRDIIHDLVLCLEIQEGTKLELALAVANFQNPI